MFSQQGDEAVLGDAASNRVMAFVTGRNIHALDPYRMPSQAALERGTAVAAAILEAHRKANAGAWPETVSVSCSGSASCFIFRSSTIFCYGP